MSCKHCDEKKLTLYCPKDDCYICRNCIEQGKLELKTCTECDKNKGCEAYMFNQVVEESRTEDHTPTRTEYGIRYLIKVNEYELLKALDSANYYHGKRNVYTIAKENYIQAQEKVSLLRDVIPELKELLEIELATSKAKKSIKDMKETLCN